ncbi:MAG: methyltransferase small [Bacteroidetes bacterium OLB11]|nr:MAG: methyltransferase small [Bacteroidetes bacterium OLB11]
MNSYFQFKQFKIQQNKCAQKVTEIACIFGAACPIPENTFSILDIGGGTGLLSLMLAQRSKAKIDCIEIDSETSFQLQDNIQNSIFKNRITPLFHDVNSYSFDKKYDLIICNPPFFSNSLKSKSAQKNKAWHDDTLSLSQLFFLTKKSS